MRDQLSGSTAPRILSFGCSVGDEILSLRRYLPQAVLTGIDINRRSLRIARRRIADPAIALLSGGTLAETGAGQFDAIVCLSVLQRGELLKLRPEDCSGYLTFAQFDRTIEEFDRHLVPGGFLLLYHTAFRFGDSTIAERYEPLFCYEPDSDHDFVRYGRDNRPAAWPRHERYALYRKCYSV